MKKFDFLKTLPRMVKSLTVLMLTMLMTVSALFAQYSGIGTFVKINSLDELTSGYYVVTNQNDVFALKNENSTTSTSYLLYTTAVFTNPTADIVWNVTVADGSITLYNEAVSMYAAYPGSSNSAHMTATLDDKARWTATLDESSNWVLTNKYSTNRYLCFNPGSPRFACYQNHNQEELSFYKLQEDNALAAPQFSVAGGFKYEPVSVTITGPAGASIYYTLDGTTPTTASTLFTTPINITTTTTVKAIAVSGEDESSVASATYSFPVVATTAEFRTNGQSNVVYDLQNCTFVFKSGPYIFVKDQTGGLCIYDNSNVITTSYVEGDVIPNIYGTRTVFNGMVELVPTRETETAIVNNGPVAPLAVTVDDILNNYNTYEGQLVKISNITFTNDHIFIPSIKNSVTFNQNNSDNMYIYNAFSNLSASVVSGQTADVIGFVSAYNTQKQLFPRNDADIMLTSIVLPYNETFEGVTSYWHFVQEEQGNQWYVGQATGFDSKALFISDNGVSNKYSLSSESVSHAYVDVPVPTSGVVVGCDYRVGGEGTAFLYDFLSISVIDPADDLEAGEELDETDMIASVNMTDGWQRSYFVIEGGDEPAMKRLVLTWVNDISGGNQPGAAIDNISIKAGSCVPPADLAVSNIEAESATITWANATDVTWQIEYKAADEAAWTTVSALANTVNLTNLSSNTEYTVNVKTVCGSNFISDEATTTFTTLTICGAPENVTVTPAAITADVDWTVAPNTTYDVQFKANTSSDWVTVMTGVTSAPVTLGGLAAATAYQVRVVAHCSVDNGTATSEVVNFTTTDMCPVPADLTATVNGNSIDLTWTSNDYFASWILQYKNLATDFWSSEIVVNQPSYTITPVQTATSYEIRLTTVCDHGTTQSNTASIVVDVPCANSGGDIDLTIGNGTSTSYYAPYNNYYGYSWNEMIYTASEIGTAGTIKSIAFNVNSASAYNCDQIKIYMGHTTKNEHASTSDWTPLSDLTLVYIANNITIGATTGWETRVLNTPFNYNGVDNLVVVVTHAADDYTASLNYYYTSHTNRDLYRQLDGSPSYAEHPGSNTGTRGSYIPNMKINITDCSDAILCEAPTNVTVSNVTSNSAVVTWTSTAPSYILKVTGPNGSENITGVTGNTYTLTNLQPSQTHYSVAVAAQCEQNMYSSFSSAASFETMCENLTIPYFTNFDNYTGTTATNATVLPSCWDTYNTGTSYPGYPTTYASSSYAASGTNSLRFYVYSSTAYSDQIAILPYVDAPVNTLMLNFDMRGYSTSTSYRCVMEVGVMTDPANAATFVPVDTVTSNTGTYSNYSIYLNNYEGNGHYIAFRAAKPTSAPAYNVSDIDNLTIDYTPSCSAPSITDYNTTTKTLTWTNGDMGTPQSYQVMCNVNGTTTNTYTFTTTEGVLLGLQGLSDYMVYVRSICGEGDTSAWSDPYTFTTPEAGCQTPSNVVATVDANHNIVVTWDADPEQSTWAVCYKGDAPIWSTPVMVTGTPSVTLSGLQTATAYSIRVNAVCNGGATESDYAYGSVYLPCSTATGSPEVVVGTGTSASNYSPFNNYYKNSRNDMIYLASEIGQAGPITSIAFKVVGTANLATNSINIYLAHTTKTTFSGTSDWTPANELTLVYSSESQTIGSTAGWETYNFDVPFEYNGTDNLVVVVTKSVSNYNSSLTYQYTNQSNRLLYRRSDSNTAYTDITNTSAGSRTYYVPNITLTILPPCDDPVLCDATVTNLTGTVNGSDEVTLAWNGTGASYMVEYGQPGFTSGTGTIVMTTEPSATISNLNASTEYQFVVYPVCSNGNIGASTQISLTTACGLIEVTEANPWLETFDVNYSGSGVAVPLGACWATPITSTQSNGTFPAVYTGYADACYSGSNSLEMKGSNQMVVLPEFLNAINTLQFDFWANTTASASSSSDAGLMEVGVYDGTTFTPVTTVPATAFNRTGQDAPHANHVAPISFASVTPQAGLRMAVRITGATSGNSWNLDNFQVSLVGGTTPTEPDVVVMGTVTSITTCNATIYDNGGADGNYETYSNETLDVIPATPGAYLHFTGTYDMEGGYDHVYIYDANNTQLADLTGEGTLDLTVPGPVSIVLESDGSVCYS
ncbi:MAG: fibronectin type III domain-containing protein, partial [Bacteroidales bacterium]|nr:fibronectin type III domain-containing protein [Bacteroidales bacterium]